MGSYRRGPWRPTGGQGPRPCSREGARGGDRRMDGYSKMVVRFQQICNRRLPTGFGLHEKWGGGPPISCGRRGEAQNFDPDNTAPLFIVFSDTIFFLLSVYSTSKFSGRCLYVARTCRSHRGLSFNATKL